MRRTASLVKSDLQNNKGGCDDDDDVDRAPFLSPAHKRRVQEVPSSTFLAQTMGVPQEIRVSEVRINQPGKDPIIYEVHDVELPPTAEELNAENDRLKAQQRLLEKQEDELYGQQMKNSNEKYLKQQTDLLDERKRRHAEEYEDWKNQVQDRREHDLKEQMLEESELRRQFEMQNERARKERDSQLRDKLREREEYAHVLEGQIQDKERQRQDEIAFNRQAFEVQDNSQATLEQMEERVKRRRELLEYWNGQIDSKERQALNEKAKDRDIFNSGLEKDMNELQKEIDQSRRERDALREDLKEEWKRSVGEKEYEKRLERDEKEREREVRRFQEQKMLEAQQNLIEERANRIQDRKNALDEQMKTLNRYREEDKLRDESMEQEMLRKIREGLMRRKLYRDVRTKKILSSKEAKRLVPSY